MHRYGCALKEFLSGVGVYLELPWWCPLNPEEKQILCAFSSKHAVGNKNR